jgi:hypothetical protein
MVISGLQKGGTVLSGLPLFHCNGTCITGLMPFFVGGHVVILSETGFRNPSIINPKDGTRKVGSIGIRLPYHKMKIAVKHMALEAPFRIDSTIYLFIIKFDLCLTPLSIEKLLYFTTLKD